MPGKCLPVCIAALLLFSAPTWAADSKTIYIDVIGEGSFEVVYHRAESNATGAAFASFIGAGIQSGIEKSKDTKKEEELRPLIVKDSWKTQFLDTLNDKLVSEGFEAVWVENARDVDEGMVLRIYPERYGFRMVDTSTRLLSAFITFKASFSEETGKNKQEKQRFYITNKNQHSYQNLLSEDSPVSSELEATLKKAAKRLANKLIYSMKE